MNKNRLRFLCISIILFVSLAAQSQDKEAKAKETRKGEFYFFWGWNRGFYSDSDIRFQGENYDFTIYDVAATDRPTPFGIDPYFHPLKISIPQTNLRLGYFINDHYDISLGDDHMKYLVVVGQEVTIDGQITNTETIYDGIYQQDEIELKYNFAYVEHTDGLNYINLELTRNDDLLELFKIKIPKFNVNSFVGGGFGGIYPKSNCKVLGKPKTDKYQVSGYGFSAKAGLEFVFFNHVFTRFTSKVGYINMPNIKTTLEGPDYASQQFFFSQWNFVIGGKFKLTK